MQINNQKKISYLINVKETWNKRIKVMLSENIQDSNLLIHFALHGKRI